MQKLFNLGIFLNCFCENIHPRISLLNVLIKRSVRWLQVPTNHQTHVGMIFCWPNIHLHDSTSHDKRNEWSIELSFCLKYRLQLVSCSAMRTGFEVLLTCLHHQKKSHKKNIKFAERSSSWTSSFSAQYAVNAPAPDTMERKLVSNVMIHLSFMHPAQCFKWVFSQEMSVETFWARKKSLSNFNLSD